MTTVNRTTLKTYFQTNDVPTEAQYENLIDSNLNLTDNASQIVEAPVAGEAGYYVKVNNAGTALVKAPYGFFMGGAMLYNTGNQSIPDNTVTPIPFNTLLYEEGSSDWFNVGLSTTNLVVPSFLTGTAYVVLSGNVEFDNNSDVDGNRGCLFRKNGAPQPYLASNLQKCTGTTTVERFNLTSGAIPCTAGDSFQFCAYQNSGSALNVTKDFTSFGIQLVGYKP